MVEERSCVVIFVEAMMTITDIHSHLIPMELLRFGTEHADYDLRIVRHEGDKIDVSIRNTLYGLNSDFFDVDRQIARMDRLGVDRSVISLATPMVNYYLDAAAAEKAARICNDGFAQVIAGEPDRFAAWAFLPMQNPRLAAKELRRCVLEYGFAGGHVGTNVRGVYLADEQFKLVFDTAADLGVPLFVHPADPAGKDRTSEYELTVVAGYLFDSTVNILRLICSGALDRYSHLKLICPHTGAFSLMLRARMQREINTNSALAEKLQREVGDYLERLYFDSVCFEPGYLQFASTIIPVEQILLGSDSPFPLGEPDPVQFVRRALPDDTATKVLSTNFERCLRF